MLAVLADESFGHRMLRGIKLRARNVDVLIAQDVGLDGKRRGLACMGHRATAARADS